MTCEAQSPLLPYNLILLNRISVVNLEELSLKRDNSNRRSHSTWQTTLTQFFKPDCVNLEPLGMDEKGVQGGSTFVDLEVERWYNRISSEEDDDDAGDEEQDDTTCVPTKWTTRNVNTAYERLLRYTLYNFYNEKLSHE
ncbi:hypothetical protein L873DRAFT_1844266 [Choiromyces venosus 120613-1]|uniref:Uncharacterized protein n=1 Tax=Choiromyces venosus 120613-1 TaxID=1336337 RepID=A0A3N4JJD5_9PEZI|nr:hypothetical protein L873DRAFT_1844266 [Choiromyces venosus 120613-1]